MSTIQRTDSIAAALPTEPAGTRVRIQGLALILDHAESVREHGSAYVLVTGRTDRGHKVTRTALPDERVTLAHRSMSHGLT